MPIFFLYFSKHLPLGQVLLLESLYYASFVLFEVPSGYISDRFGRKRTLMLSSSILCLSYALFFWTHAPASFAIAQVLLALGLAMASGTDTSFLYDTLHELGREDEYGDHESALNRLGYWSMAVGALTGGAMASLDLSYAYGLSLIATLGAFLSTLAFVEPQEQEQALKPHAQLRACLCLLHTRPLNWLFGFSILSVCLSHIPYEFYQSYLELSVGSTNAPFVASVHTTIAMLISGWLAGKSMSAARAWGTRLWLLTSATFGVCIITVMSLLLHPVIVVLLLMRDVPNGIHKAPLLASITPRLPSSMRATYLSLQSLSARLSYSVLLAILSIGHTSTQATDWSALSSRLTLAIIPCAIGLIILIWWRPDLEPNAESCT